MVSFCSRLRKFILHTIEYILFTTGIVTLFNKKMKSEFGIIILYYHRISGIEEKNIHPDSIRVDMFKKQMKYLSKNYTFISLNDAVNMLKNKDKLDKDYIVLTFDDGYRSILKYWDGELQNLNIKPTIYIIAGHIENQMSIWTDEIDYIIKESLNSSYLNIELEKKEYKFSLTSYKDRIKVAEFLKEKIKRLDPKSIKEKVLILGETLKMDSFNAKTKVLDWASIKMLKEMDFDIASHTMNHFNLANMSNKEREYEIIESYKLIYKNLGIETQNFSYPFGYDEHYNKETIECAKEIYNSAVTVKQGINYPGDMIFELKRISGGYERIHVVTCRILKEKIKRAFLKKRSKINQKKQIYILNDKE